MAATVSAPPARRHRRAASIAARDARTLAAAMLAVAAVRPYAPVDIGIPCPLRTVTGIPCPLCGMTRGVTALVHGDVERAFVMNPGAFLAVGMAVGLLVTWVLWRPRRFAVPAWAIGAVLGVLWSWQLFKLATGRPL